MVKIKAFQGDITLMQVDAIVNAANQFMRGGGGVDGAIHAAGGNTIFQECVENFPHGLPTGEAGATTAGLMPSKWVIHAVGPKFSPVQDRRSLLNAAYRNAMRVADNLGAQTVAFPLIGSGIFGWTLEESVSAAIEEISGNWHHIEEVTLVGFDAEAFFVIQQALL